MDLAGKTDPAVMQLHPLTRVQPRGLPPPRRQSAYRAPLSAEELAAHDMRMAEVDTPIYPHRLAVLGVWLAGRSGRRQSSAVIRAQQL